MNIKFAFALLLAMAGFSGVCESSTIESLSAPAKYLNVKISPGGDKLGLQIRVDGKVGLIIVDTKNFERLGGLKPSEQFQVADFHWANNDRIVVEIGQKHAWKEELAYYGELYAIDVDGSSGKLLFGYRAGEMQTGTFIKRKEAEYAWATLVDTLPEDREHILISSEPMSENGGKIPTVKKLNVYTGETEKVVYGPIKKAEFVTDSSGEVRFAQGWDEDFYLHGFYYDKEKKEWIEIGSEVIDASFQPLVYDSKNESLLYLGYSGQDRRGFHRLNVKDGTSKPLYTHDTVDVTGVEVSADGKHAYALRIDPEYTNYLILKSPTSEARLFRKLLADFNGSKVNITSRNVAGDRLVFKVSSDIQPGSFYLYDESGEEEKVTFLLHQFEGVDSRNLARMEPVKIEASDGVQLHGYLTDPWPNESTPKPMVILVHGGPRLRDYWTYDPEAQMLASQGIRVLQVNFRGSDGYGKTFLNDGNLHWGDLVQRDIADATKWAVAQKVADPNKICIMGSSFGAYSAVQNALLYPDQYKCVVATAGVYDLPMMFEEGDIRHYYWGESYLKMALGRDKEALAKFSPVNHIGNLKADILLVHGARDKRAPIEQAEALIEAMEESKVPFQQHIERNEAHGFLNEGNRAEYFKLVSNFINSHIGTERERQTH